MVADFYSYFLSPALSPCPSPGFAVCLIKTAYAVEKLRYKLIIMHVIRYLYNIFIVYSSFIICSFELVGNPIYL